MHTQRLMKYAIAAALLAAPVACKKKEEPKPAPKAEAPKPTPPSPPAPVAKPEVNVKPRTPQDVAKWYADCWGHYNKGEWEKFGACYSPTATVERTGTPTPKTVGRTLILERAKMGKAPFPDMNGEAAVTLINGNRIFGLVLLKGTHTAPMKGPQGEVPATNKRLGVWMSHEVEVGQDGAIVADRSIADSGTMMGQLGLSKMPHRPVVEKLPAPPAVVVAMNDAKEKANLAVFDRNIEAFNKHDAKAAAADCADDMLWFHSAEPKNLTKAEGIASTERFWKAFSDVKLTVTGKWAAGDYVVARGSITGTNDGDWADMGLKKTGRKVDLPFAEVMKMRDGKLVEDWIFLDGMMMAAQLGMMDKPEPTK